ncbi:diguanylate cyclase (GGDEF) domain-containing protein [Pseudomonas sp. HPB0071]|uniref:diguanylate cyclase n=1 Tax=unclassified Pseudomonas TaxID=196821 RepID=UPI0002CB6C9A|nr:MULTISPECIES: diguanylate cyclase [unclassified Pseudomonas]ENA26746.1 diguanylate cyclase (GGDEF) domain-containing protein [Pseudomonas sp. HPB0071]
MERSAGKGYSFAKRIYGPRIIGLGLGFWFVAMVLATSDKPTWVWILLVVHSFLWPHLALEMAKRSSAPFNAEWRNLIFDSLLGGFWVAVMQFNSLPSVMIISMMAMHNIAAGGVRLCVLGLISQLIGALIAIGFFSFSFEPYTSPNQIYACLPMLFFYPLILGWVCYRLSIQLAEHKRTLRKASSTDSLTGLLNHGSLKYVLEKEFLRCKASNVSTSIALLDIDNFKQINDTYGHIMGDNIIRYLGEVMHMNLRTTDSCGRYGGDEFCIILPHTSPEKAFQIMERIRFVFSKEGLK